MVSPPIDSMILSDRICESVILENIQENFSDSDEICQEFQVPQERNLYVNDRHSTKFNSMHIKKSGLINKQINNFSPRTPQKNLEITQENFL